MLLLVLLLVLMSIKGMDLLSFIQANSRNIRVTICIKIGDKNSDYVNSYNHYHYASGTDTMYYLEVATCNGVAIGLVCN